MIQVQWVGKLCFVVCVRGGRPPLLCFYDQLFHREGLGLEAGRSVWVEGRAVLAQDLWPPPTVSVAFISAICHPSVEFGGTETWLSPQCGPSRWERRKMGGFCIVVWVHPLSTPRGFLRLELFCRSKWDGE